MVSKVASQHQKLQTVRRISTKHDRFQVVRRYLKGRFVAIGIWEYSIGQLEALEIGIERVR